MRRHKPSPVRGQLDPPDGTERTGWRWLQCTETPDEFKVLLPPRTVLFYQQVLKAEARELQTAQDNTGDSWQRIIYIRHLKDRMIRKCQKLAGWKSSHKPPVPSFLSVHAPPDFRLREMEDWCREQAGEIIKTRHHKTRTKEASSNTHRNREALDDITASSNCEDEPMSPASPDHPPHTKTKPDKRDSNRNVGRSSHKSKGKAPQRDNSPAKSTRDLDDRQTGAPRLSTSEVQSPRIGKTERQNIDPKIGQNPPVKDHPVEKHGQDNVYPSPESPQHPRFARFASPDKQRSEDVIMRGSSVHPLTTGEPPALDRPRNDELGSLPSPPQEYNLNPPRPENVIIRGSDLTPGVPPVVGRRHDDQYSNLPSPPQDYSQSPAMRRVQDPVNYQPGFSDINQLPHNKRVLGYRDQVDHTRVPQSPQSPSHSQRIRSVEQPILVGNENRPPFEGAGARVQRDAYRMDPHRRGLRNGHPDSIPGSHHRDDVPPQVSPMQGPPYRPTQQAQHMPLHPAAGPQVVEHNQAGFPGSDQTYRAPKQQWDPVSFPDPESPPLFPMRDLNMLQVAGGSNSRSHPVDPEISSRSSPYPLPSKLRGVSSQLSRNSSASDPGMHDHDNLSSLGVPSPHMSRGSSISDPVIPDPSLVYEAALTHRERYIPRRVPSPPKSHSSESALSYGPEDVDMRVVRPTTPVGPGILKRSDSRSSHRKSVTFAHTGTSEQSDPVVEPGPTHFDNEGYVQHELL